VGGSSARPSRCARVPATRTRGICETEAGFLNSIGLENKGIDHYVQVILPDVAQAETVIVTNIGAERVEEFAELAARSTANPRSTRSR
jgi:dihydroorotate dehydrogenase (NAD+) catalytic subunit